MARRAAGRHGLGPLPVVLALCAVLAPAPLPAAGVRLDAAAAPRIVNGLPTQAFAEVGALLYSGGGAITAANAQTACSGTLIGCQTFVVAAHCVGDPNPAHYWVYLQHAGLLPVRAVRRHPEAGIPGFPVADVAVLKLEDWVPGITPAALNGIDPLPFIPSAGTIAGFGQTQGGAGDYGIKRHGAVQTALCPTGLPGGAGDSELVCWRFLAPLGAPGSNANTCHGDSGGPLFLDLGAGPVLAGVTAGGASATCLPPDQSFDANVFTYRPFLLAELGADATAACGGLAPVGEAATAVTAHAGGLDASNPLDVHTFTVPAGANALRVALNGEDNGSFDADLYVRQGSGAGPASYDCRAEGRAVYGSCAFDHPAPGTWSLAVARAQGAGSYQVTATVFGGPAPQCGNGVREFDEACDGADAARCDGLCQPDCSCPAPLCGNGVREAGEACDGSAAGDCAGDCSAACQCALGCSADRLYGARLTLTASRLRYRARLLNFDQQFTGADPRDGLRITFRQGALSARLDLPAGDAGWAKSRPDKGRYLWRGARDGFRRVKALDRSAQSGTWRVLVSGAAVSGGGAFDLDAPLEVELVIGSTCTRAVF